MTLDPAVHEWAKQWAGRSAAFASLLQAVVLAEGNILKAVQCSEPSVQTEREALMILARSACHALADYVVLTDPAGFVHFWAHRWAPVGAANDPRALNANWPHNVLAIWDQPSPKSAA